MTSTYPTKRVKRRLKRLLQDEKQRAKTEKEKDRIQKQIVSLEECHPRRPRCAHFGEMIQMDAAEYV